MTTNERRAIPLDWLCCPFTKEKLVERDGVLHTERGATYRRHPDHGFWDFIPKEYDKANPAVWRAWEQLQANGMTSYVEDPVANVAVGPIPEYVAFGDFCEFRGNILDVGVGPQANPTHLGQAVDRGAFFVGIDPLLGEQPRDFAFVQGLGEYLPFRDGVFDQVLFVTSLDHFIDPLAPLAEARRVLRDGGTLLLFHGEKDAGAPRPSVSPQWYQNLKVPEGAEDPFHFKRFGAKQVDAWIDKLGMKTTEVKKRDVDQWRREFFYRVVK